MRPAMDVCIRSVYEYAVRHSTRCGVRTYRFMHTIISLYIYGKNGKWISFLDDYFPSSFPHSVQTVVCSDRGKEISNI